MLLKSLYEPSSKTVVCTCTMVLKTVRALSTPFFQDLSIIDNYSNTQEEFFFNCRLYFVILYQLCYQGITFISSNVFCSFGTSARGIRNPFRTNGYIKYFLQTVRKFFLVQ